ncbi:MAG: toxin-antitoxin system YwqK family antitoxin [Salibacteraceae bacterium]
MQLRFSLFNKISFFLILFGFIFSNSITAQKTNVTDENGLKQGYWEKKQSNGSTKYKGQFKDDKPYGKFKYYDKHGTIITILEYSSPDSAIATHYHSSGKKAAYGYYVHQKKEGVWRFYDRTGLLASKENFKDGVLEGEYIVYNLNGSISRETFYVKGVENGYRKTFSSEGELLTEGNILDGQMDGIQKIYRGGKINIQGAYKHAVRDGEWNYYDENGELYKTEIYELGIRKN